MVGAELWTIVFFFFNDTATTEIYTLSLHDALPISPDKSMPRARISASVSSVGMPRSISQVRRARP